MRGCFAEADTWECVFTENRHMVFFWKLPGKGSCDVSLEGTFERAHGYKYNLTDSGWCSGIGSPYHSLLIFIGLCLWCSSIGSPCPVMLIFACHDVIDNNSPKNFSWYSNHFLSLWWTWEDWQSFLVSSGANCCCWFVNGVCKWIEILLLICVNWTAVILTTQIGFPPKNNF